MKNFYTLLIASGVALAANAQPTGVTRSDFDDDDDVLTLKSLVVAGHEFITSGAQGATTFTATGKYYDNEVSYKPSDDDVNVEKNYDSAKHVLILTLKKEGSADGVYTVTFEGKSAAPVFQIPNSDFDNWTVVDYLYGEDGKLEKLNGGWNSFDSATGLMNAFSGFSPKPLKLTDGYKGNAVRIISQNVMSMANANGNLTTGFVNMGNYVPTDASNYNFTDRTDSLGNLPFAGHPDAFEVYARFTPGTAVSDDIVLNGRLQFILHGDTAYHDPELDSQMSQKIGSASVLIPATADWTKFTGTFSYNSDDVAKLPSTQYMLASATTNPVPGASQNDMLDLDELKLIYWHDLSDLTTTDADGNDIDLEPKFTAGTYVYKANCTYDEYFTEIGYKKIGFGAKVETDDYDESTGVLTVTVKGEDYDAETNPDAKTVYTIQYLKPVPTLSSLVVAGHEFIRAGSETTEFTATGNYYADEVSYTPSAEVEESNMKYDKNTNTLTISLHNEGTVGDGVYTIKFEGNEKNAVYQIPNFDFENWSEDGSSLAETWNSFESASGLFATFASMSPLPTKVDGYQGNGVRLTSKDLWIAYANGNMTTGHINMGSTSPADESNFNFTDRTDVNGNLPFAGIPDAFEVYARFTPGTAKTEGTALQGRVQLILHGDAAYHDPEVETMSDAKIAMANVLIPETKEWTKFTGEFNYTGADYDGIKYLLASATTNPVPGASKDDQLDLDNLKLIYYHALSDLKFDGKTIEGFDPEITEYEVEGDIDTDYDKVTFEKIGVASTCSVKHDFDNSTVTITVNGNDIDVNPDSKTVYTIMFKKPTSIGSISADEAKNHKVYTIGGVRVNGKPTTGLYIVDGKKMMVK